MPSKPNKYDKRSNDPKAAADKILNTMSTQARAQFGDAVKSFWFYDGEFCPGCLARPTDKIRFNGKDALSINAFLYRPRAILIGYGLCETCATFIHKEAQKNPYKQTPLHADIERNLAEAYQRHLSSLDA